MTVLRTNLLTNPSFETAGSRVAIFTNLITNPAAIGTGTAWLFGGIASSGTYETGSGPIETYAKNTIVTPASGAVATGIGNQALASTMAVVTAGTAYTASIYGKYEIPGISSLAARARIRWYDSARVALANSTGPELTITNGEWTRFTSTGVTAPANSAYAAVDFYIASVGSAGQVAGDYFAATGAMLTATPVVLPYFGGNSKVNGEKWDDADFSLAWTGTANASTSTVGGLAAPSWNGTSCAAIRSSDWSVNGSYSVRLIPTSASANSYVQFVPAPGFSTPFTALATLRLDAPQTGTLDGSARRLSAFNPQVNSATAPNAAGVSQHRVSATLTSVNSVRLYNGASIGGGDVWWDAAALIAEPNYAGDYFDGSTPANGDYNYKWTGTTNASTSQMGTLTPTGWVMADNTANFNTYLTQEQKVSGTYSLRAVATTAATIGLESVATWSVTTGQVETLSIKVRPQEDNYFRIVPGTGFTDVVKWVYCPAGVWTEVRASYTATANTSGVKFKIISQNQASVGVNYDFDTAMTVVDVSAYAGVYFDGSYPNATWTGTANASTSTAVQRPDTNG